MLRFVGCSTFKQYCIFQRVIEQHVYLSMMGMRFDDSWLHSEDAKADAIAEVLSAIGKEQNRVQMLVVLATGRPRLLSVDCFDACT